MKERLIFLLLLGIDAAVLLLESNGISISYREARTLYDSYTLLHFFIDGSLYLFGQNDIALRLPMIAFHLLSVSLFYGVSGRYCNRESDRLWLAAIFMLLPGINSAALLVDNSAFVITGIMLYLYLREKLPTLAAGLLGLYLFIDDSFALLYLGLFFYGVTNKRRTLMVSTLLLFGASMYLYGFDTHGSPKGHFLDVLGLYAAIFSPILFIYLVYILFRKFVTRSFDLLWYLSATPLGLSLLLSFRQEIDIQMFAPYLLLAMPLAAQAFFHSYRVRLKMHRRRYRLLFTVSFALLLLHALAVFFNKELYRFMEPGQRHFAQRQHVAKELANALKAHHIECIETSDAKMQLRLYFYGIGECPTYQMSDLPGESAIDVTISYINFPAYPAYVTKILKN
jgi:hypothetical protein